MLGVDAGGTFTDVVSVREGRIEVTKVPSSRTDPAAPVVARASGATGAHPDTKATRTNAGAMAANVDRGRMIIPPTCQL
jgi:N-methylhydantoinase A